jgi:hypothetical protein
MLLHCTRCNTPVSIAADTRAPYWCPYCRIEFTPAAGRVPTPNRDRAPAQAALYPEALPVAIPVSASAETSVRAVAPPPLPPPLPNLPSRARVPLPAGMPEDVAALGEPEAVYPPEEKQVAFNRTLVYVCAGLATSLLLGVAALMFFAYLNPSFGTNRPPDAVFLLVGAGLLLAGVFFFGAALWYTNSAHGINRWGPRTYLVYRDVLAEVFPDHHRIIPLEKLRAPDVKTAIVTVYRFPVAGERALTFDNTVRDHTRFCELLQARSAERRFRESFGDESVLFGLCRARIGPSVLAVNCKFVGEVFRITVLGDRLLFYKVANGGGLSPTRPPNPFGGLVGAISIWAHAQASQKFLQEMREVERADAATLLDLAARNDGSFVVGADDVRKARLNPPSAVRQFLFGARGTEQHGLVQLVHAKKGDMTLALLSAEDAATVREWWPRILGQALTGDGVGSQIASRFAVNR